MVWRTTQEFPLLWRDWGEGEVVVYHTGSGDTHIFNEVGAEVLRQLDGRSLDLGTLCSRVIGSLGLQPDAEFERHVGSLLAQLDELGLIEPVR